jgi:hypothetical protein
MKKTASMKSLDINQNNRRKVAGRSSDALTNQMYDSQSQQTKNQTKFGISSPKSISSAQNSNNNMRFQN